jgi:uncharacterized protein YodC (DUF2158 family)
MENQFKAGDCVQLKYAGGDIKMVIDQLFTYQGEPRAVCKWLNKDGTKFEKEAFSINALKPCEGN